MIKDDLLEAKDEYLSVLNSELKFLAAESKNRGIDKEEFLEYCSKLYGELD